MKQISSFLLKGNYDYPASFRIIEILGIIAFTVFCILLYLQLISPFGHTMPNWLSLALISLVLLAYFTADFISGFVHFLGDTFGTPETPVLGPGFIKPFRDHHTDPQGIVRHDWIEVNASNCIVCLFILIPVYFFVPIHTSTIGYLTAFYLMMVVLFILCTNQFHKWAHMEKPPVLIAALQKMGLILPPDHHNVHHTAPNDKYYCITCGWMNSFLFKIHFFEFSEKVIRKIFPDRTKRKA